MHSIDNNSSYDYLMHNTNLFSSMVRIQKRIRLGMHLLQYFTLREWKIKNHNFLNDSKELNEKESKIFYLANIEFDKDEYLRDIILGTRKFCLKEDLKTLPRARRYLLL